MGAYVLVVTFYAVQAGWAMPGQTIETAHADRVACYKAKAQFERKAVDEGKQYTATCRPRAASEARPVSWIPI